MKRAALDNRESTVIIMLSTGRILLKVTVKVK